MIISIIMNTSMLCHRLLEIVSSSKKLELSFAQFRSVFQSVTHSYLSFSPVLQVRSHTGARGTAATGASLVRTS